MVGARQAAGPVICDGSLAHIGIYYLYAELATCGTVQPIDLADHLIDRRKPTQVIRDQS
jgi:hypothetical protein